MDDLTPNLNYKQNSTMNKKAVYKIDNRYKNNFIHPTAIIGDNVQLGQNNYIGALVAIEDDVATLQLNNKSLIKVQVQTLKIKIDE